MFFFLFQFLNSPEVPFGKLTSTPVANKHKITSTPTMSVPTTSSVLNTPTINLDGR